MISKYSVCVPFCYSIDILRTNGQDSTWQRTPAKPSSSPPPDRSIFLLLQMKKKINMSIKKKKFDKKKNIKNKFFLN